jgi:hypothetical protein
VIADESSNLAIFGFLKISNASLFEAAKGMYLASLDSSLQGASPKPQNFLLVLTVFERIPKKLLFASLLYLICFKMVVKQ